MTVRPWPNHIPVRLAFGKPDSGAVIGVIADSGPGWVDFSPIPGGEHLVGGSRRRLTALEPDRLAMVLAREDLTLKDGLPGAIVNLKFGMMAIAAGPPVMPSKVVMVLALHIEDQRLPGHPGGYTERTHVGAPDGPVEEFVVEPQPGWWLVPIEHRSKAPHAQPGDGAARRAPGTPSPPPASPSGYLRRQR